jgi:hypothetical protein
MIDFLWHVVHWCASCAPDATSIPPAAGLLGGAAGAAGGVAAAGGLAGGDAGDLNYTPSDSNRGLPPEDVSSQMRGPSPDKPIQPDDDGNALAAGVVGLPIAAVDGAYTGSQALYKAANAVGEDILGQAKDDLEKDYLDRNFPGNKDPYENPGDYRMGKPLGNQDGTVTLPNGDVLNPDQSITGTNGVTTTTYGYTKNPDGTLSPPANQSPAFNPDGNPVGITDPGDLPPVP